MSDGAAPIWRSDADARARFRVTVPSIAARLAQELRFQLAEGQLLPGTQLKEESLSAELGVSRNTIREAFAELAAERLVVRKPNRGVFVATLGAGDLDDVFTVRRIVELGAIRAGGGAEDVAAVRAAVTEGQDAAARGDSDGVGSANQHFHHAIVSLARSERLDAIMSQLLAEMRLFFHKAVRDETFHLRYLDDNDRICTALESGDPEGAERMLAAYLDRSHEHLIRIHRER